MTDSYSVPYGRVSREFVDNFIPAKASWLEINGTSGYHPFAWFYQVTGTAYACIRTAFTFELSHFDKVALEVGAAHGISTNQSLGLAFKDVGSPPTDQGVSIWSAIGESQSTYRAFGVSGNLQVPYYWGGAEMTRRRNLGLVVYPQKRLVHLTMDDQVIWEREEPDMHLGTVKAVVDCGGPNSVGIRIAQFKLTLVHN